MKPGDIAVYSPPRVRYNYGESLRDGDPVMIIDFPFKDAGRDSSFVRVLTPSGKIEIVVPSYLKEIAGGNHRNSKF